MNNYDLDLMDWALAELAERDLAQWGGPFAEDYCDYCEQEGHTFRSCPARDDDGS